MTGPRNLTDADVAAIAKATAIEVREGLKDEIYRELGKGVLAWSLKCLIAALFAVTAYTGLKGVK